MEGYVPLISVILPVYNVEKYLPICIESVLGQKYNNLEIILVNDGSTDKSPAICEDYAKRDGRIRVIRQHNKGLASARNSGIAAAQGEYLFFVDSDDCINPRLIDTAVELAEQFQAKIVQVELEMVAESFQDYNRPIVQIPETATFSLQQSLRNLDVDNQDISKDIRLTTTVVWNKLYHRTIFEKVRFAEGLRIHEDQMVMHRLITAGNGMVFLKSPLYYYRENSNSLIRAKWHSKKLAIIDCYKDRINCILDLPDTEEAKELLFIVYRRYLICIIKNYMMVDMHMDSKQGMVKKRELINLLRRELKEGYIKLRTKDRLVFKLFSSFPNICLRGYLFINLIVKKDDG